MEKAIEKLNDSSNNHDNTLLSPIVTCELLKIKRTAHWKWTKKGRLTSY